MGDAILTAPLGRGIRLYDQTWMRHILRRHPEVKLHRDAVERAVTNPLEIRISPSDEDCRFYFGEAPRKGILVLAVVDVKRGLVKTAHFVRAMKGSVEWSKPMQ